MNVLRITVVGTGYVGLVTGTCFAELGNHVTCVDIDQEKLKKLEEGIIPIYEPGLEPMVISNFNAKRLKFSDSLQDAMKESSIYFIAVGTPPGEDGSADLKYVLSVAKEIGQHMTDYCVVVDKSTVPVGTADKVREVIQEQLDARGVSIEFDVVSNPEFLKEGDAIQDFMRPDRIIVGTDSDKAQKMMAQLYSGFSRNHDKVQFMGVRDAEMTKYAANAILATKISFMNEVANICEKLGIDVENVRKGIGADKRIGYSFIYPGCGYGGSCFPKDVKALVHIAEQTGLQPKILQSVEERNNSQKHRLFEKVSQYFSGNLSDKTFAVWGLAFKPGTDDMREATSIVLINALLEAGANVVAYDPVAAESATREFDARFFDGEQLKIVSEQYEATAGADALILVTEWKAFVQPDFALLKTQLNQPAIFDGRNLYDPSWLKEEGFYYEGVGRVGL